MPPAPALPAPICVIRFTEQVLRQCRESGRRDADRMVCDTIVNGSRSPKGGQNVVFERVPGGAGKPVRVLGRLGPGSCLALKVISRLGDREKNSRNQGFLIRSGPK